MRSTAPVPKNIIPGAHVLVVGLGKSGLSAVKFLRKIGVKVSVSEGGRATELDRGVIQWLQGEGVIFEIGGHSSDFFSSADCIYVSPGVPLDLPLLNDAGKRGIPIIGELALVADYLKTPLVAITGTNGKSTVTTLIGDLFAAAGKRAFVGGNLGIPLTDYLAGPQDADVVVAEVSSFQLDTAGRFRPDVGILLNISPDHLDRYDSFDAYVASKFKVFGNQCSADAAIINADDPVIMKHLDELKRTAQNRADADIVSRLFAFGLKQGDGFGAFGDGRKVMIPGGVAPFVQREEYDLSGTALSESPNRENAMAAILAVRIMGCSEEAVKKGLAGFKPLPHRMTLVAEFDGVQYYDDSKATNVGAVLTALQSVSRPVVLIAGGRDKGGEYEALKDIIGQKVKAMILLGEAKEKMAKAFKDVTNIQFVESMTEAVHFAQAIARSGDAVMLSPACASFDMYKSYAHRGEVFCKAVLENLKMAGHDKQGGFAEVKEASAA